MKDNQVMDYILKSVEENYPGYKVIYMAYYGSKLFGLDNPNSDSDFFGIFIPSKEDVYLMKDIEYMSFDTNPDEKNTKEDDDIKLFSIYHFFRLLRKGDHGIFDLLFSMFSDKVIYSTPESLVIKNNYKRLVLNKPQAFTGFALKQANQYSVKGDRLKLLEDVLESLNTDLKIGKNEKINIIFDRLYERFKDSLYVNKITKTEGTYISVLNREFVQNMKYQEFYAAIMRIKKQYGQRAELAKDAKGVDFKAFSHALRATAEAKELITTGFITLPLKEPSRTFIKDVKEGKYPDIKFLSNKMEEDIAELNTLQLESPYPDFLDTEIVDELILKVFNLK